MQSLNKTHHHRSSRYAALKFFESIERLEFTTRAQQVKIHQQDEKIHQQEKEIARLNQIIQAQHHKVAQKTAIISFEEKYIIDQMHELEEKDKKIKQLSEFFSLMDDIHFEMKNFF